MKRQILAALGIGVALLVAGAVMSATYLDSNVSVNSTISRHLRQIPLAIRRARMDSIFKPFKGVVLGPMKGVEVKASPVTLCNGG